MEDLAGAGDMIAVLLEVLGETDGLRAGRQNWSLL